MNFFRKPYTLRRYKEPKIIRGYHSIPYEEFTLPMDVQTMEDTVITTPDGSESVQRLKVFCDEEILVENEEMCIRIPMLEQIRSLNLSNSVAIVLYEALRQNRFREMQTQGELHRLQWS